MKREFLLAAAGLSLLSACGGEGGSSPPPTSGAPSPTPTPAPTPTPTPTPTYSTFAALASNSTFESACFYRQNIAFPPPRFALPFPGGLKFAINNSTSEFTVTGEGVSRKFIAADAVDSAFFPNLKNYRVSAPGNLYSLSFGALANNTVYTAVALYSQIGSLQEDRSYACVIGSPTQINDSLPNTGRSYSSAEVNGFADIREQFFGRSASYKVSLSSSSVSFNASQNAIELDFSLLGQELNASGQIINEVHLGKYRGSGTVNRSNYTFSGTIQNTDLRGGSGNFTGRFFGPQGSEIGLAAELFAVDTDNSRIFTLASLTAK